MDILENACEIEMKGEQLYRDMAAQSDVQEIHSIFKGNCVYGKVF